MKYEIYVPCREKIAGIMANLHKKKTDRTLSTYKNACQKKSTEVEKIVNLDMVSPHQQMLEVARSEVGSERGIKLSDQRSHPIFIKDTEEDTTAPSLPTKRKKTVTTHSVPPKKRKKAKQQSGYRYTAL